MGDCDDGFVIVTYCINVLLFGWIAFAVVYGIDYLFPSVVSSDLLFMEALIGAIIIPVIPTMIWIASICG